MAVFCPRFAVRLSSEPVSDAADCCRDAFNKFKSSTWREAARDCADSDASASGCLDLILVNKLGTMTRAQLCLSTDFVGQLRKTPDTGLSSEAFTILPTCLV